MPQLNFQLGKGAMRYFIFIIQGIISEINTLQ